MSMDKIALFDMDDTLVDFQGTLRKRLEETRGPDEKLPESFWDMPDYWFARAQAIKKEPGFWRDLPRLQWGWEVLEIAREIGFDIHILTKGPTTSSISWGEKVDWVRANLPDATLHITDDKRVTYGRVLVDDYHEYMDNWLEHRPRGLGIVNYETSNPNLVNVYDGLYFVRQRLQQAFDR